MKEDVLEQIVDDYLQFKGYFTTHNIRFRPHEAHEEYVGEKDRVRSDVDVVGYHPRPSQGTRRVVVVTCKSWQSGFNPRKTLLELRENRGPSRRPTWHHFRELWVPKWSEAFVETITQLTGESVFDYRIAVTRFQGDNASEWAEAWDEDPTIKGNLPDSKIGFLTLEEMWGTLIRELSRTPASSEIGRLAQLLKAAGLTAGTLVAPPAGPMPGSDAELVDRLESDP